MRDPYPKHGKRRPWYAPWRVICRCGLDAYPCTVVRMQQRQAVEAARDWRDEERAHWLAGGER